MKTRIVCEWVFMFPGDTHVDYYQLFGKDWHKVFDFSEGVAQIKNIHPVKKWEYVIILIEYED